MGNFTRQVRKKRIKSSDERLESRSQYENLYARRAAQIIQNHDISTPLFLYLPFQSVHEPIHVPEKYEKMYPKIQNKGRRQFCGMVSALDEAIGNITTALTQKGIYEDTLIIFTADNGGWTTFYGNNYPLRGSKFTVFEGGTRASAFVHGTGLQNKGTTNDGLMHAVDWHPTILSATGGTQDANIDGIDQWKGISERANSDRTEFIYNLDDMQPEFTGHEAIRVGDFKLIDGYPGPYPGWYKPQSVEKDYEIEMVTEFADKNMLFNLKDDPYEHNDLSEKYPDVVAKLKAKIAEYEKDMVKPDFPRQDPASDPDKFGGFWTPGWC